MGDITNLWRKVAGKEGLSLCLTRWEVVEWPCPGYMRWWLFVEAFRSWLPPTWSNWLGHDPDLILRRVPQGNISGQYSRKCCFVLYILIIMMSSWALNRMVMDNFVCLREFLELTQWFICWTGGNKWARKLMNRSHDQ